MSQCKSCRRDIVWAATEKGGRMPLDAEPVDPAALGSPRGLFVFRRDSMNRVFAMAATPDAFPDERLYRSHFATCPHAKEHRRR